MVLDYDEGFDILYIHLPNKKGLSYGDDSQPGKIVYRDMDTDEIVGYAIYKFKENLKDGKIFL